jgi:serine/threonine protein kinase
MLGRNVALKFLRDDDNDRLGEEVKIHMLITKLRLPHTVPLLGSVTLDDTLVGAPERKYRFPEDFVVGRWCLVMPRLRPLPNPARLARADVARLAQQLVTGVGALHGACIVHSDLSLGNLLLDDEGKLLVSDFGQATLATTITSSFGGGTPGFQAPEQLEEDGYAAQPSLDMFSVGCCILRMALPQLPSEVAEYVDMDNVCTASLLYTLMETKRRWAAQLDEWQSNVLQLTAELVHPVPGRRPTAAEVLAKAGAVFAPSTDDEEASYDDLLSEGRTGKHIVSSQHHTKAAGRKNVAQGAGRSEPGNCNGGTNADRPALATLNKTMRR